MRTWFFPLFKITRNPDTCTLCKKCDRSCPMAIKVSESGRVNHVDCHLCCDCVTKCPEKGVLQINRKPMRWLPPVIITVLIAAGILFSLKFEVPTISMMWANNRWRCKSGDSRKHEEYQMLWKLHVVCRTENWRCKGAGREDFCKHHKQKFLSYTNGCGNCEAIFIPSSIFWNDGRWQYMWGFIKF